jgi:hypothetical protein
LVVAIARRGDLGAEAVADKGGPERLEPVGDGGRAVLPAPLEQRRRHGVGLGAGPRWVVEEGGALALALQILHGPVKCHQFEAMPALSRTDRCKQRYSFFTLKMNKTERSFARQTRCGGVLHKVLVT